jgi:hypothetical protein
MARKPIGEAAMTPAERQRCRRQRLGIGGQKPDADSQARIAELEARLDELEAQLARAAAGPEFRNPDNQTKTRLKRSQAAKSAPARRKAVKA